MARGKSSRLFRRLLILIVVLGIVFVGFAGFRSGPPPVVTVESDLPGIGKLTTISVVAEEPKRGLTGLKVELVQGDRVEQLEERRYEPLEPWEFWGRRQRSEVFEVEVGSEVTKGLQEGEAEIRVLAERAPAWLSRPDPVVESLILPVKLRPPTLQVMSRQTYVDQGGCEAVVYKVGESSTRDGVQAGDWWFPGYPLPGGDDRDRFALFAVPYDLSDVSEVRLVAADDVDNVARATFIDRFRPRPFKTDTIRLSDSFMERVVPAILDQSPQIEDRGDLLQNYLAINGELRKLNAQTLIDVSRKSVPEFLWDEPFLQMRNAKVMSNFADRRTYLYNGEPVDQQDHLGYDLASTALAEIESANDGIVVLARYLGIYGNVVAIDHGYGLLSLYGHLSSITVEEGQQVQRGDVVGRSGTTGLAGGDHLHFTMMLQGLPVNPSEWWDGHWIHDRLKLKLGDAMPFEE
jgi:murein DD-endopeptidase MepM/ murein hydrolase activator NlpD